MVVGCLHTASSHKEILTYIYSIEMKKGERIWKTIKKLYLKHLTVSMLVERLRKRII